LNNKIHEDAIGQGPRYKEETVKGKKENMKCRGRSGLEGIEAYLMKNNIKKL